MRFHRSHLDFMRSCLVVAPVYHLELWGLLHWLQGSPLQTVTGRKRGPRWPTSLYLVFEIMVLFRKTSFIYMWGYRTDWLSSGAYCRSWSEVIKWMRFCYCFKSFSGREAKKKKRNKKQETQDDNNTGRWLWEGGGGAATSLENWNEVLEISQRRQAWNEWRKKLARK